MRTGTPIRPQTDSVGLAAAAPAARLKAFGASVASTKHVAQAPGTAKGSSRTSRTGLCVRSPRSSLRPVGFWGQGRWRWLVYALALVAAVWVVLFIWRVHANQPNVDDYWYAWTAKSLLQGDPIRAFLHTGQTAPLVPAMASVGARAWGIPGALAIELPLLLLLVAGSYALARTWLRPEAAMVLAMVAGLNTAVLGYSMMLNFAVASTTAVIWCFVSYQRSNHLRKLRWALLFGVAMAALALSRTIAPVYFAPLVLVVGCDYVIDIRRTGEAWRWPAFAALGVVVVVAGPWWLVSGHDALHYLSNAGYSPSSGFASRGATLTPSAIATRISDELSYLGQFQGLVLAGALVATAIVAFVNRRRFIFHSLWMLAVWSVLTLLVLSTSSNSGTAFGLPVIAMVIVLCGAVLGQLPTRALGLALAPLAGVVIIGLLFQFSSSTNSWFPGPPYRVQVVLAGGTSRTNVGLINDQVADAVGDSRTLLVHNDAILNENGFQWSRGMLTGVVNPALGPTGTASAISDLPHVGALITGGSQAPFFGSLDQVALYEAAERDGFRPYKIWIVSPHNNVIVWRRRTTAGQRLPLPRTTMLRIKPGSSAAGGSYSLDALASQPLGGVAGVQFQITGPTLAQAVVITARGSYFGWTGNWDTTAVPNGTYMIRSVATDVFGQSARSSPLVVHVDNPK
jgi:hypothetical protein